MRESFKLFIGGISWKVYVGGVAILLTLPGLYNKYVKPRLSRNFQIDMPTEYIFALLLIAFFLAAYKSYDALYQKRLDQLYASLPEAKRDKAVRVFYNLLKEGKHVKNSSSIEIMQEWDYWILEEINNYCKGYKNTYLLKTGRRYGKVTPIQADKFDAAIAEIQILLDHDSDLFLRT